MLPLLTSVSKSVFGVNRTKCRQEDENAAISFVYYYGSESLLAESKIQIINV